MAAPTNLHATAIDATSISLAWNAVTGASGYEVTVLVSSEFSAYSANPVPPLDTTNPTAYELGVKFRVSTGCNCVAVRFYKGTDVASTHTVRLWSSTGISLATATTTSETATGWQRANFATAVTLVAGTTYVASYDKPASEQYPLASGGLTTSVVQGILTLLADGTDGGNALYGTLGTFPTTFSGSENYYIDPVVSTTGYTPPVAPTTAPTLSGTAGDTQNVLNWTTVSTATSYNLKRGATTVYSGANLTFTDTGLTNNTAYSYTVNAANSAGQGPYSSSFPLTPVPVGGSGIYPRYRGFLANRTGDLEAQGSKVTQYDVVVCNAGYYSQLTTLKANNPTTLFYKYMNSIACITGSNDHVGQNNVIWSVANANDTWFLHTTSAVRMILADFTTNSFMDPATAGYQAGWASEAAYQKNTLGWHGVFIDDVNAQYGGHLGGQTPAKYSYAGGVTNPGYVAAQHSWCAAVGSALRSSGVKHIGNDAIYYEGQTAYRANLDALSADLDASMFEFWVTQGNTDPLVPYSTTDHAALLDRGLYTQATLRRGFVPLVYFNPAAGNYNQMYRYTYYSFLLTVDPTLPSAFMVSGYSGSQSPDVPTYYGNPTATYQSRGTYCYSRTFNNAGTNYTIYVNADTVSHSLDGHTIPALDGLVV